MWSSKRFEFFHSMIIVFINNYPFKKHCDLFKDGCHNVLSLVCLAYFVQFSRCDFWILSWIQISILKLSFKYWNLLSSSSDFLNHLLRIDIFLLTRRWAPHAHYHLQAKTTKLKGKLVGLNGLEPSTSRLSGGRSNLLSYKPIFTVVFVLVRVLFSHLVEIIGIEPMTPCLQSRCSPSWAIPP